MGMAVRADLVVSGAYDFAPVDTYWRVRLEHNRGIRPAPVANGALNLRRGHSFRISLARAPLYSLAVARSPNRRPRVAPDPAGRDTGSSLMAICVGLRRASSHIAGIGSPRAPSTSGDRIGETAGTLRRFV